MGSSDSPRRLMSATLPVVGSQLMPYQLEQQLVPDHVLKMPKYGSLREDLKASNAARSDGVQLEEDVGNESRVCCVREREGKRTMGGGLGNWEMRFVIYIVLDEHVLDLLSNLRFKFTPYDDKPHQLYQKAFFHHWQAHLRISFASAILSLLLTSNVHTNQASAVFRTSSDVSSSHHTSTVLPPPRLPWKKKAFDWLAWWSQGVLLKGPRIFKTFECAVPLTSVPEPCASLPR
ncbi:hypothetical protein NC651_022310 [Populus alba x Populus x berolinensis]|nr:hypothetical protein NC651_022302 [Populus alba x Populus x berolinensis]KAJ6896039.1 hypothetical protein NC651_022310 [Populus alba x Populus x berolinensis]